MVEEMETGALKCCLDMGIQPGTREGCLIISRHVKRNITKQSREWHGVTGKGWFFFGPNIQQQSSGWRSGMERNRAALPGGSRYKTNFFLLLFRS